MPLPKALAYLPGDNCLRPGMLLDATPDAPRRAVTSQLTGVSPEEGVEIVHRYNIHPELEQTLQAVRSAFQVSARLSEPLLGPEPRTQLAITYEEFTTLRNKVADLLEKLQAHRGWIIQVRDDVNGTWKDWCVSIRTSPKSGIQTTKVVYHDRAMAEYNARSLVGYFGITAARIKEVEP